MQNKDDRVNCMYFLIDFENVKNTGMRGTEYLLPTDHVIVFYSDSSPNMETRFLEDIKKSKCSFEICKLVKHGKNALDFYIATKLGEIFGKGFLGQIAVISCDSGFQALREYWANCADSPHRVVLNNSIERAIISANEANSRTAESRNSMRNIDIGNFFAAYEESRKLQKLLEEAFADTAFSSQTNEIEDILKNGKTAKVIYLNTLHRFGRKNGLTVYRTLKNCVNI